MKKPRKSPTRPIWEPLEHRQLLAGSPTGRWVGQDQHDFVGRSSTPGPSGVQDIRITLENLPIDRSIVGADIRGHGGGQWLFRGNYGPWAAAVTRDPGSASADVFVEPYQVETGRQFSIQLKYDDGTTSTVYLTGGAADPGLRMPAAAARVTWVGQDGSDRVGLGPSVGPDGRLDAVLALANLSPQFGIDRVNVSAAAGLDYQSGTNPMARNNAEVIRSPGDPTQARLFLQPDRDLAGIPLVVRIQYDNGTADEVSLLGSATDPARTVPTPAPFPLRSDAIAVNWLGQSVAGLGSTGDVGLRLVGLPIDRSVVGATLSDDVRGSTWSFKSDPRSDYYAEPGALPLTFRRGADPTTAEAAFTPTREENGSILTLRVAYDDGTTSVTRFSGGAADLSLRAPAPAATEITARPGDDLNALADQYGTVVLSPGEYRLSRPLTLSKAVRILGQPGATIVFDQAASEPAWTAAIKVHKGNTTLQGFAVRFAGPVRWDWSVAYDPAVIGTTDPLDPSYLNGPKVNLTLSGLDLEGPPVVVAAGTLQHSPKLFRLVTAENGKILGNTLRGGTTQVHGGPWEIAGNTYLGATPGTLTFDVFAGQWAHDLSLHDNVARSEPGSGKTYRFLVLAGGGDNISVANNAVEGIGPRDDDTIPHPNAPETILTEAYRIRFEGKPLAISPDGRVVQIPAPQGEAIQAGDVLSVLSGPDAGQWRRVAQVLGPTTLLLEAPLPTGTNLPAISVSTGFIDLSIVGNVIDDRGSSQAAPLVLVGAQFNTEVRNNRFRGGSGSRIVAMPSELPVHWGWSFTPVLDVTITGNTFEDALKPLTIGVERSDFSKTSKDRVYFEGDLTGNIVAWSPAFLSGRSGTNVSPIAFRVGHVRALDPIETQVHASGNALWLPPGTAPGVGYDVHVATLNDEAIVDASLPLPLSDPPAAPTLRLYRDTGSSDSDGLTSDGRLALDGPAGDLTYEYSLDDSSFTPLAAWSPGQPISLGQLPDGETTLWVRAVDAYGRTSDVASLRFTLDTTAPAASAPALDPASDTGRSNSDRITSDRRPVLQAAAGATEVVTLLVNGVAVASRVGPGPIQVPTNLTDGPQVLSLFLTDPAGNTATSPDLLISVDTVAPAPQKPILPASSDTGISNSDRLTSLQQPTLLSSAAPDETVILLVDGREVLRRTGGGDLTPPAPLAEGSRVVGLRVEDVAGNSAFSAPITVTIDSRAPRAVTGLRDAGLGRIAYDAVPDAAAYEYRLGNGPFILAGNQTTFRVPGLAWGANTVTIRAIDAAGNISPEAVAVVTLARPRGTWMGQGTRMDLAGPWSHRTSPDGFADARIQLADLPVDREIAFVDIQGKGSGRWQFGNPLNQHWRVAVVRAPAATTADLYFQPGASYPAREYQVEVRFHDGSSVFFYLKGGTINRSLRGMATPGGIGLPRPASSGGASAAARSAAARAQRLEAMAAARSARLALQASRLVDPGTTRTPRA